MKINNKLINEVLDAIFPLPDNFGIDREIEEPSCLNQIEKTVAEVDEDAYICYGISKLVIVSPNFNGVVIKIPFYGSTVDGEWIPFTYAPASDKKDYCLAEYERYLALKKLKLDCFVAKTIYYKKINGRKIFLQEEVISEENILEENEKKRFHHSSKKSRELAWKIFSTSVDMDVDWIAKCFDKYRNKKVRRFFKYCATKDRGILEDMHCGNFGYRDNGTPCLIDFSDFLD